MTTNESATCRYATTAGTAYGQMETTFATTGGTAHSHPVTGLANGQSYAFYVRCQDTAGNATTADTVASFAVAADGGSGNQFSMQFFGTGTGQIDRVEIPLTPNRTIDVGGDFTLEWWMRATPGNGSGACVAGGTSWVNGNVLIDRDVSGPGDFGDFGVSLFAADGRIAFGVSAGTNAITMCSTVGVNDGSWHHVAVTRAGATGAMAIYVDGVLSGSANGPTGDVSYRDGRATTAENDPFLVLGAEKHDAGPQWPSYRGLMDELRVSNTVRYTSGFARPRQMLIADATTVALYRFDEGSGTVLTDVTGGNNGVVQVGGNPSGPVWSADRPF